MMSQPDVCPIDNLLNSNVFGCGGACSCVTCHCYADVYRHEKICPANIAVSKSIEIVIHKKYDSRLSCQLTITEELDGLVVRLPESQYKLEETS